MGRCIFGYLKISKISYEVLLILAICAAGSANQEISLLSNCSSDPCMYGICLDNDNSTYSCYCIDGYTGINCEINWDDCWSNPCQNGGTCNDAVAAYNCTCPDGYIGLNCEQKYSECANQPCLNNGTCVDYDGFFCQCPDGYSGDYCEIDASVCNDTICKNFGECIEGPGYAFYCRCSEGWTGQFCDEDVDECVTSPCKNGGLCINVPATYTCACLFGYTGKDCDKTVIPCEENPCENGAICLLEDNKPVCYCVPDYHGSFCELRYDDCTSKAANCKNGGTCIDGINSFTCSCPPNLSGPMCEEYVPEVTVPSKELSEFNASTAKPGETFSSPSTSILDLYDSTSFKPPSTSTGSSSSFYESVSTSTTTGGYSKWYSLTEEILGSTTRPDWSSEGSTEAVSRSSLLYTTAKVDVQDSSISVSEISISNVSKEEEEEKGEAISSSTTSFSTTQAKPFDSSYSDFTEHTKETTIIYQAIDNVTKPFTTFVEEVTSKTTSTTSGYLSSPAITDLNVHEGRTMSDHVYTEITTAPILTTGKDTTTVFSQDGLFTAEVSETTTTPSTTKKKISILTTLISTPVVEVKSSTIQTPLELSTSSTSGSSPEMENITIQMTRDQVSVATEQVSTSQTTECIGNLCATNATVPSTDTSTKCDCSRQNDDECNKATDIESAAFNGKSYARQRVDVNVLTENITTFQVYVKLRTRFQSGIIYHVYFDDERYALVYLQNGALKFQLSCAFETVLFGEIDSSIDDGFEVEIDMSFQYSAKGENDECSARLLVNGTTAVSGEQILPPHDDFPQRASLHLGGIPLAFSHYFPHVTTGFLGCMNTLKVNNIPKSFIHDSVETFQIEECTSFICLSNPCKNFGVCEERNGTFHCHCIAGYSGVLCERSACDDNPCSIFATCINSPVTGFICICPLGTHGLFCEKDTVITHPSFSILAPGFSSYIAYGISNSIRHSMELKMKLIPSSLDQISLIAYLGQSRSRQKLSDHLSVSYVRGYIMLTWDLGSGVRRIFTNTPLTSIPPSLGVKSHNTYIIHIGRIGRDAWLAVDGIGNVTGQAAGSMTQLDVSPILYIGGHKSRNFEMLPHDLPLHTGFSGCIFDIELRIQNTVFPVTSSSLAAGRGVGECHRNECIRHSCKNGAVCLNHGPTYSCICTKDWTGPDCSVHAQTSSFTDMPTCCTAEE